MMAKLGDREWHKRLPEFEAFDKIELCVVPRFKTSGLSGDEWRTGVRVAFYFKESQVHEEWYRDMQAALMLLPGEWIKAQEPIPDAVLTIEESRCDQPGCAQPAIVKYVLRSEFSRNGDRLDPTASYSAKFRRFCAVHKTRGDCGLEDSDANYEPMGTP